MAYLNVSPMISALREQPDAFCFESGELHHIPSRHRFLFDSRRHVTIDANCGCSLLHTSKDQEIALYDAYQEWRTNYWRAIEINREFAAHFAPPTRLRAWLIALTGWLHRAALTPRHRISAQGKYTAVPAE
jgi:hypothetical protein